MSRAPTTEETLRVAAVTAWPRGEEQSFRVSELEPGSATMQELVEAAAEGPVWLDLHLASDVSRWLQPWDPLETVRTDWSAVSPIASELGLGLEKRNLVLDYLPLINEYGVLPWLSKRAFPDKGPPDDGPPLVMPLVGFIPADTLPAREDPRTAALEYVLLRVNLAAVGKCLVTIRLTDRLCSGSRRGESGLRIDAAEFYDSPILSASGRFLRSAGLPSAEDLGEAVASYLVATCNSAAESARDRLRQIEKELAEASAKDGGYADIKACHDKTLAVRATLERVEEELSRLLQRLSDPHDGHAALARAQQRYDDALRQLHGVEADTRWVGEAATNQLATRRFQEQRTVQSRLERVVAWLGTILVFAALVPSLFSESAKLPSARATDFIGMLLIMIGAAGFAVTALVWVPSTASAEADQTRRNAVLTWVFSLLAGTAIIAGGAVLRLT